MAVAHKLCTIMTHSVVITNYYLLWQQEGLSSISLYIIPAISIFCKLVTDFLLLGTQKFPVNLCMEHKYPPSHSV